MLSQICQRPVQRISHLEQVSNLLGALDLLLSLLKSARGVSSFSRGMRSAVSCSVTLASSVAGLASCSKFTPRSSDDTAPAWSSHGASLEVMASMTSAESTSTQGLSSSEASPAPVTESAPSRGGWTTASTCRASAANSSLGDGRVGSALGTSTPLELLASAASSGASAAVHLSSTSTALLARSSAPEVQTQPLVSPAMMRLTSARPMLSQSEVASRTASSPATGTESAATGVDVSASSLEGSKAATTQKCSAKRRPAGTRVAGSRRRRQWNRSTAPCDNVEGYRRSTASTCCRTSSMLPQKGA
mmetsp:Transcript_30914/g.67740  ORF Transcript_30914/g.67740 Transcript_30914/m.67740 type:complete len:304 (-) Transcript_30914:1502-2413(-)